MRPEFFSAPSAAEATSWKLSGFVPYSRQSPSGLRNTTPLPVAAQPEKSPGVPTSTLHAAVATVPFSSASYQYQLSGSPSFEHQTVSFAQAQMRLPYVHACIAMGMRRVTVMSSVTPAVENVSGSNTSAAPAMSRMM